MMMMTVLLWYINLMILKMKDTQVSYAQLQCGPDGHRHEASGRVSLRYTRIYCIRGCLIGISEQRGGSGPRVA